MKNEDTRVQFTKKILKDSLLKLLRDKPIGKVTIKELCDAAGLNRGTFYLHYNEPNDLLREIEEEFVREKMCFFDPYMKNDNPDQLAQLFGAIMQNRELSLILFGRNGAPQFTNRIKNLMRERILEDWQREFPSYSLADLQFVYEFFLSGRHESDSQLAFGQRLTARFGVRPSAGLSRALLSSCHSRVPPRVNQPIHVK
ncbi:MAG: TetR/AcrR family transcriptional regulator [Oscillospiraceae bacterium]|nr:TetR/AcrR family transcriptional regulator [Oscillospiraceae bacterium]